MGLYVCLSLILNGFYYKNDLLYGFIPQPRSRIFKATIAGYNANIEPIILGPELRIFLK